MTVIYSSRSLPLRIPPVEGESFVSYIDRLSHDLRSPVLPLLQATGLADADSKHVPSGFGVFLQSGRLEQFCRSADLPRETVEAMLLTIYDGVCADFSRLVPDKPRTVMSTHARRWTYFYGTHACPECLAESGGVWKLAWKLPWSFACARHRSLLVGACPKCGRRLRAGKPRNPNLPDSTLRGSEPVRCSHLIPVETGAAKWGSAPCGHHLHEAARFPTYAALDSYPRLIEAQERVNAALAFSPGEATRAWFSDLGVLSVLLLSYGSDELYAGDWPAPVREALEIQQKRREGSPVRWRSGVQERIPWRFRHAGPPEKPALLAALVSEATRILACDSMEETAKALEALAVRVRAGIGNRNRGYDIAWRTLSSASPELTLAFESVWMKHGGPPAKMAAKRLVRTSPICSTNISPDHLPQLFWQDEFEKWFAELLPGMNERYARRYCSLALVRQMGNYAWKEAALLLQMPPDKGESAANRGSRILKTHGNKKEFSDRIDRFIRLMAEEQPDSGSTKPRIEYGSRRRTLTNFEEVPWEEWKAMCRKTGHLGALGKKGRRNRVAAAHIWYLLAGGDPLLSPAIWRKDCGSLRYSYRKLAANISPALEAELLNYGLSLLPEELRPEGTFLDKPANG